MIEWLNPTHRGSTYQPQFFITIRDTNSFVSPRVLLLPGYMGFIKVCMCPEVLNNGTFTWGGLKALVSSVDIDLRRWNHLHVMTPMILELPKSALNYIKVSKETLKTLHIKCPGSMDLRYRQNILLLPSWNLKRSW